MTTIHDFPRHHHRSSIDCLLSLAALALAPLALG